MQVTGAFGSPQWCASIISRECGAATPCGILAVTDEVAEWVGYPPLDQSSLILVQVLDSVAESFRRGVDHDFDARLVAGEAVVIEVPVICAVGDTRFPPRYVIVI